MKIKIQNWEVKEFLKKNNFYLFIFLNLAQENENIELQEWIKKKLLSEKMNTMKIENNYIFPEQINNFISRNSNFEYLEGQKLLFYGPPGLGKTFAANKLAEILNIDINRVEYNKIISKRMGDTMKNLEKLFFDEKKEILFFDEVDVILTNRIGSDIDEMKRATGNFMWLLDNLSKNKILILATNIFEKIDEAILRRMDYIFNFNQYNANDLVNIYKNELNGKFFYIESYNDKYLNRDLFFSKKIINLIKSSKDLTPYKIKKSIDLSEKFFINHGEINYFYMIQPYIKTENINENDIIFQLKELGFSINEIFIILKKEFSISNDYIRKKIKEISNEN